MAPTRKKAAQPAKRGGKSAKQAASTSGSQPQLSGASSSTTALRGTQPSQTDQEEGADESVEENAWADLDRLLLDRTLHLYTTSPMHFPSSTNGSSSTSRTPSVAQLSELSASCTSWLSPRLATLTSAQSRPAVSVRAALVDTASLSREGTGWALQVRIRTATSTQSGNTVKRSTELITAALVILPGGLLLSRPASRVATASGGPRSNLAAPLSALLLAFLTAALDTHASSALPARALRGEALGALLEKLWKTSAGAPTGGASVEAAWDVGTLGGGKECESLTLTVPLSTAGEACGGVGKAPIHELLTSYLSTHVSLTPPPSTLHRIGVAGVHVGISGSSSAEPLNASLTSATLLPPGATAILDALKQRDTFVEPEEEEDQEPAESAQAGRPGRPAGLVGAGAGAGTVRMKVTSTYGGDAGARLRLVCKWAIRQLGTTP